MLFEATALGIGNLDDRTMTRGEVALRRCAVNILEILQVATTEFIMSPGIAVVHEHVVVAAYEREDKRTFDGELSGTMEVTPLDGVRTCKTAARGTHHSLTGTPTAVRTVGVDDCTSFILEEKYVLTGLLVENYVAVDGCCTEIEQ